jgi:O-antigen ligase
VPLVGGIAVLALVIFKTHLRKPIRLKPDPTYSTPMRLLDFSLIVTLAAIALQLVPLSPVVRGRLTPAAVSYDRALRFDAPVGIDRGGIDAGGVTRPTSIDPHATALALLVVAAIVLLYWSLRTLFQRGGVRAIIRGVAWIGLFLSPLIIVQHLMALPILEEAWGTTSGGVRPFGPFVNRNDFAGWLIMAMPLTLGYAVARMQSRHRPGEPFDPEVALDSRSLWFAMAICLMVAGLLFSLSRSGLLGACAGLLFFAWRSRGRMPTRRALLAIGGFVALVALATTYADVGSFATRFGSLSEGLGGRLSIWRQTLPVVRDFWIVGTGAGTYQSVMVLYQTMSRYYYISHADNELLQIAAEGGLLVGVPVALAIVVCGWLIAKRLREDHTGMFWLRVGASAGMFGIVTQNMVEMTLRLPANAVLFAVLAAIATCEGQPLRNYSNR